MSSAAAATKSAVVAGAAGAVGGATCGELARRGWRVFAGVRSEAAGQRLYRSEWRIVPIVFGVTDEVSLAAAAEQVERELGGAGLDGPSKTALESITDALRMELKHFGVEVSLVDPSHLHTDIFAKADVAAATDGYAGTVAVQQLYGPVLEATGAALAKQRRNPVDTAVKPIVKALTARRPKTRYLPARDARRLAIVRHLPDRVRDRMLMSSMGMKKHLFVSSTQQVHE